jgi:hypothetical protein
LKTGSGARRHSRSRIGTYSTGRLQSRDLNQHVLGDCDQLSYVDHMNRQGIPWGRMVLNGHVDVMPHFPKKRVNGVHLCLVEEKQLAALYRQEIESPALAKLRSPDRSRDVALIAI